MAKLKDIVVEVLKGLGKQLRDISVAFEYSKLSTEKMESVFTSTTSEGGL